jgi:hypothetical protein
MLVISVHGPDRATTASGDTAALVDDADDVPPIVIIESPAAVPDRPHAQIVVPEPGALVGHSPEIMIFRPPRAAAFV